MAELEHRQPSYSAGGAINTVPICQAVVCWGVAPGPLVPIILPLSVDLSSSVLLNKERFMWMDHPGGLEALFIGLKFACRSRSAMLVSMPQFPPLPQCMLITDIRMLFAQHKCGSVFPLPITLNDSHSPSTKSSNTQTHAWSGLSSSPPPLLLIPHLPTHPAPSLGHRGAQDTLEAPSRHFCLEWSLALFQTPSISSNLIQGVLLQCCSTLQVPKAKTPGTLKWNPSSATYFGQCT